MCTAVGGVPDSHNITLLHLNQLITTSIGNKLQAYIANDLFWEFTCIVESLYTTKQVSLLWYEKGMMQIRVYIQCLQHSSLNFDLIVIINSAFSAPVSRKQENCVYSVEGIILIMIMSYLRLSLQSLMYDCNDVFVSNACQH